ncbi:MAG: thioredoxin domain-containing protein [Pseudomonadota bacterium]
MAYTNLEKQPNRLIDEKSPYLLQHAYNPVDWYPWCDQAFEKARLENKPIFLSIGYSTCHWCHVMEKESFEDHEVARLMNKAFVSIKVDREERPDLDHIYMTVCQILTGSGGWPLTVVMTPDKKPFFAATYIPKEARFGRMGMMDLVPRIMEVWTTRHDEVVKSADKIVASLISTEGQSVGEDLDTSILDIAYDQLAQRFDERNGGFSEAPKFPTPHNLFFLLRYWHRTNNGEALEMVEKTLREMRMGGIYDHIGFGFHRYSTDPKWLVPHFEKMLYDQALLSMAYIEAYQATGKKEHKNTTEEIFTYVLRDMTAQEGGFFSAEDADSEGEEGKFYVWTEDEVRKILPLKEVDLLTKSYNLKKEGNFFQEATGRGNGTNILYLNKSLTDLASDLKMPLKDLQDQLEAIQQKLFTYREGRIHPHKDDKILADWNGLMIAALAKGSQAFGNPVYAEAAKHAADFILSHMREPDGRLLHRYRDGQSGITASADDYAFLIWGLIELYEATFDPHYLKTSIELNKDLIGHFWDEKGNGLFFTPDDGEKLIVRKKEIYDGAIPSGNAVAMLNLLRLSRYTGNAQLEEKAMRIGRAFSKELKQFPSGYTQFMVSVDFGIGPSHEVVIVGDSGSKDTKEMLKSVQSRFIPNQVIILRPIERESDEIDSLSEFIKYYQSINGRATAYICRNNACKAPTTEIREMMDLIN